MIKQKFDTYHPKQDRILLWSPFHTTPVIHLYLKSMRFGDVTRTHFYVGSFHLYFSTPRYFFFLLMTSNAGVISDHGPLRMRGAFNNCNGYKEFISPLSFQSHGDGWSYIKYN